MIPSKTKDKDEPAKGTKDGEVTPLAATKVDANANLAYLAAHKPEAVGWLPDVYAYLAISTP